MRRRTFSWNAVPILALVCFPFPLGGLLILSCLFVAIENSTSQGGDDAPCHSSSKSSLPLQEEDNRRVLALYDGNEGDMAFLPPHLYLEMPLNRLGMIVEHHDVRDRPLPDSTRYHAILLWFSDNRMDEPIEFLEWLSKALKQGQRLIAIGGFGAEFGGKGSPTESSAIEAVRENWGLQWDEKIPLTDNPFLVEIEDRVPAFGFESPLPPEHLPYECIRAIDNSWKPWRILRRRDRPDSESIGVATGPRGGFVFHAEYIRRLLDSPFWSARWDINPFLFLEAALGLENRIRPDVTTVCGARAAFSHIDSDGMANRTQDLPGKPRYALEVIIDEIFKKIPVPITLGVIASHCNPEAWIVGYNEKRIRDLGTQADYAGDHQKISREESRRMAEEMLKLIREALSLPHIQLGCHGYAHPLDWKEKIPGLLIEGYSYTVAAETSEAMAFLEKKVAEGKRKVELFQWTGNCHPTEEALAEVAHVGVANINGGDSRYDRLYASLYHIAPLSRQVGSYRQVYTAAQNENLYTELWTENFGGFARVIETFERSEVPRLLPVNVYYHIYSGERQASLRALHEVYDWCLKQPLCWIHAAEYARAVEGFFSARTGRRSDGTYWIEDFGECRTVRWDLPADAAIPHVDMEKSRGVWGYTHHAGSLYVTLAPGKRAEIALTPHPPRRLVLRRSTSLLRAVRGGEKRWQAEARLYAPGMLELWGGKGSETLSFRVGKVEGKVMSDSEGMLKIPLPQGQGEWVEVYLGD